MYPFKACYSNEIVLIFMRQRLYYTIKTLIFTIRKLLLSCNIMGIGVLQYKYSETLKHCLNYRIIKYQFTQVTTQIQHLALNVCSSIINL